MFLNDSFFLTETCMQRLFFFRREKKGRSFEREIEIDLPVSERCEMNMRVNFWFVSNKT